MYYASEKNITDGIPIFVMFFQETVSCIW